MYTRRLCLGLISLGLIAAQDPPAAIQIVGAVKQSLRLTADDLAKMPRAPVETASNGVKTAHEAYGFTNS
ncbi:MAG: hypothetical protein ABIZ80_25625 [Bryobacteraceae bacterium]